MTVACINVAYACNHRKGGDDDRGRLPGDVHALWLESAVLRLRRHGLPVLVSMTGWPGWPDVPVAANYFERDTLWRVFTTPGVHFITMNAQPGHQVGAAWCVRLGLEAASKFGWDYMVHTAEDVLPAGGAVAAMLAELEAGADYVGLPWGEPGGGELNSQFFACRVRALVGPFDPPAVGGVKCLEKYLGDQLAGKWVSHAAGAYRHTHDPAEYARWLEGAP